MLIKRVLTIGVVAAVVALVRWALRPGSGTDSANRFLPPVGSDTWPPVPANPDRPG
jgi:hypothetical protein